MNDSDSDSQEPRGSDQAEHLPEAIRTSKRHSPVADEPRGVDPGFVMDDREKKLAIVIERRFERRITSIIRQESGDSYAGLPADHVLVNLDKAFPHVNFPERMMARLEKEQDARIEREAREDALNMYEAETRRVDAAEDRKHLNRAANRAFLVLLLMLAVGLVLIFTNHEAAGIALIGTTMVTIIVAFLRQQFRPNGR